MLSSRTLLHSILGWPRRAKQLFVLGLDFCMSLLAMWIAFTLRLDTPHAPQGLQWLVYALAPFLALPVFATRGLYRAIFRYTGIRALLTTAKAVALYGALLMTVLFIAGWNDIPRSIGLLQPLVFLILVGASRALGWFWLAHSTARSKSRLLIYGAGSAGAQTAAGLVTTSQSQLLGFVDDDPKKIGRSINGMRVYAPQELPAIVYKQNVTDILLAIPSATRQRRHQIIESVRQLPVHIRTLPGLSDLASGRVTVTDFQELGLEDLLGREPVAADSDRISQHLADQIVMVTGAGGSIGSELCRKITFERPSKLILVDHSEYALYTIHQELLEIKSKKFYNCTFVPLLANICNKERMASILRTHKPTSIYHAAAYKHVPLVESNAGEGILNNVFGTLNLAQLAIEQNVNNFVLVSTDKAVRPTNIMGASKRVAEQILQAIFASDKNPFVLTTRGLENQTPWRCPTRFSIVRFGNVLGSSGSVIPLFRQQISAGGPLTVTHPEVNRYFMTISEAAQLVLNAGAMAEGGDLFLLDMGEPIRIEQLARRMVALSGLTVRDKINPNGDIEIVFTGLRPGEKLYEELLISDHPTPTTHPRILRAREEHISWNDLSPLLSHLEEAAKSNNIGVIVQILQTITPGYPPSHKAQPSDFQNTENKNSETMK